MKLTFLGTGAPIPTADRVQTGLLLETDDSCTLIDCGSGVLHRLAQADIELSEVSHVLLTHHHPDHVSDLLPFLRAKLFSGEPSLGIAGPEGTEQLVDEILAVHDYHRDEFDLTVREITSGNFSFAGFDIAAIETRHVLYCLAYRLTPSGDPAATISFSGDSEAFDQLAEFAAGSDILVHDCAHTDDIEETPHATPGKLGQTLSSYEYGQVYLTHLYPETDGHHDEMINSIRKQYDGEVRIPHDGLSTEIAKQDCN